VCVSSFHKQDSVLKLVLAINLKLTLDGAIKFCTDQIASNILFMIAEQPKMQGSFTAHKGNEYSNIDFSLRCSQKRKGGVLVQMSTRNPSLLKIFGIVY